MSSRITERTLYPFIGKVFESFGWRYFSETVLDERFPDLVLEGDGAKIISEVKIDSEIQLTKAIIDADQKARRLGTRNAVALLFPSYVRDIPLSELERSYPRMKVSALVLTDWLAERKELSLEDLAEALTASFKDWLETKKTRVSYDLVVDVARDSIREIAGYLRQSLSQKPVLDSAMAVVGRFDIYKSLLEDFSGIKEDEARLYIADITAYILVNQLLFYHIISEKLGYDKLPDVDPLNPPKDFLDILDETFKKAREIYPHILGFDLFPVLRGDYRIVYSIARILSTLKALRPQHIREDLFGRLYHETIPPETRKNLGAFYTKPEAAKVLAALAIDRWDAKVLDPACGSGTLLVEAYHRKAQLAPHMTHEELHKRLIDDIYGIDVMHFAFHMTSMNLTAQDIDIPLKPHVMSQDGIKVMIQSAQQSKGPNDPPKGAEQSIAKWLEIMKEERIPKDFDVIIMNPPFTRRERIPAKKEDLEQLVPEVKGKTGYWAYFVVAADKLLKENGMLAIVIPEEFFVGKSAQSIREYLFERGYAIRYILRSAAEVAFSESAHYRDYLIILQKGRRDRPLVLSVLKKKLDDLREKVDTLAFKILEFETSADRRLNLEEIVSLKISNVNDFVGRHIGNLKPLVGFNSAKAYALVLELLDQLKDSPTMEDYVKNKTIEVKVYNPGQFTTKGVERFARKLFISRYGARSPNTVFLLDGIRDRTVFLKLRRTKMSFEIPVNATVFSLRTYSKVNHMDITDEEERAIIDAESIPQETLKLAGLLPLNNAIKAANDVSSAYKNISGNILLIRKARLTSPDLFWTAFFSKNKMLGTTSALLNMNVTDVTIAAPLVLYLNSTVTFLQLIAFMAETEGAWVTFHGKQVWSHIHMPQFEKLQKATSKAQELFKNIHKIDAKPLSKRIKEHDPIQKAIDELALEMLGVDEWKPRLDEIYDATAKELQIMHKILETSENHQKNQKQR
ncbi:MAG: HsdM family class I SAM-dependent methyltransferase [Candidatus Bathyarchaeia archaeon]